MPRPPIDLARKIKNIFKHVQPLPNDSKSPVLHYGRTGTDIWASLAYVEKAVRQGDRYPLVIERHLGRLYGMALVNLVENFERFLKEIAADCVDCLAEFIGDDRFNTFKRLGSTLAAHFEEGTPGKSLCESSTWLSCEEINERFRKLLSDPFQSGGKFHLFPKPNQKPEAERWRFETMNLIWQIRHTSVHNVGIITRSDAVKLRLWAKETVPAPRILAPTRRDLTFLKRFLDETADLCNERIGRRLAELLTTIHNSAPILIIPQEMADRLAAIFRVELTVSGSSGIVPTD